MLIEMGIGWVPDEDGPKGHIRSANPGEYAKEIERLRALLAPFAAERLPSSRKTEIAHNRHGLRCCMSPLEIAKDAAYAALNGSVRGGVQT